MRTISYADQHFTTSDAIAERVLDYAKLMGRRGTDDVVRIPALPQGEDTVHQVDLLIGPASQITAVEVDGDPVELPGEEEVVADLDRRIASLAPPRAGVDDEPQGSPSWFDDHHG